jgi:hypothetical protein
VGAFQEGGNAAREGVVQGAAGAGDHRRGKLGVDKRHDVVLDRSRVKAIGPLPIVAIGLGVPVHVVAEVSGEVGIKDLDDLFEELGPELELADTRGCEELEGLRRSQLIGLALIGDDGAQLRQVGKPAADNWLHHLLWKP